jgi:hypothetical protein
MSAGPSRSSRARNAPRFEACSPDPAPPDGLSRHSEVASYPILQKRLDFSGQAACFCDEGPVARIHPPYDGVIRKNGACKELFRPPHRNIRLQPFVAPARAGVLAPVQTLFSQLCEAGHPGAWWGRPGSAMQEPISHVEDTAGKDSRSGQVRGRPAVAGGCGGRADEAERRSSRRGAVGRHAERADLPGQSVRSAQIARSSRGQARQKRS